jgi:hypothetical protein
VSRTVIGIGQRAEISSITHQPANGQAEHGAVLRQLPPVGQETDTPPFTTGRKHADRSAENWRFVFAGRIAWFVPGRRASFG